MKSIKFLNFALAIFMLGCSSGDDSNTTPEPDPDQEVKAPVATADSYTTGENEAITIDNFLENDTIYDYGRITDIDSQSSQGGTIEDNRDGTYTYTPASNFIGEDTFTYTLCDAEIPANCSEGTVTITVTESGPVATNDAYDVQENTVFQINNYLENDQLLDNSDISSIETSDLKGTAVLNENGSITYTAPNGFAGEDIFTYTICDDDETPTCATATITITVIDEGTPEAKNDKVVVSKDNQIEISNLLDNDVVVDDAAITSIDNTSTTGSVTLNANGSVTYIPTTGFVGTDSFSYTICDDDETPTCSSAVVTVEVVEPISFNIPSELEYYYGNIPLTTDEDSNFDVIRELTIASHTTILTYGQRHNYLYDADADLSNAANVILMYSGESRDRREYTSGSNSHTPQTFNTEHIYPQSKLTTEDAVTDLHHLRSADDQVNGQRSNYPFVDGSGTYQQINGNTWYPGDEWRGDVARMVMYLNVRYGETFEKVGTLELFLKWNREDPVSDFEKQRNAVIEGAQGDRNPFIDNPYLATLIWGGQAAENTWE